MSEFTRKSPAQARSAQTVDTLLEATAQILEREPEESVSTNTIARTAGFSIGTIYQYFLNKDALYVSLARREMSRSEKQFRLCAENADAFGLEEFVRAWIRTHVNILDGRTKARRSLILKMFKLGLAKEARPMIAAQTELFIATLVRLAGNTARPLSPAAAYVVSRALIGTIHVAILEQRFAMKDSQFEDELVELVLRFIRQTSAVS